MSLMLLDRDITRMETDAIVNAANVDLLMGGGVCGAIFRAAGPEQMSAACAPLAPIRTGEAVITPGFALPAKYVIHTAGPIYRGDRAELCEAQLRDCYRNSLALAEENGCHSVAFPLVSGGIFGYPREEAVRVAEKSIREYLLDHDLEVFLLLRDKSTGLLSQELKARVRAYLNSLLPSEEADHMVLNAMRGGFAPPASGAAPKAAPMRRKRIFGKESVSMEATLPRKEETQDSLEELVGHLDESFSQTLLRLIDAKGRTDVEVYKRANLDRKLFSKIRTGKGYMPSKRTALALAVALELSPGETEDLLARAGYALSHSQKFDVIVEYFIINGIYDIFLINEALFQYDQPLLGGA